MAANHVRILLFIVCAVLVRGFLGDEARNNQESRSTLRELLKLDGENANGQRNNAEKEKRNQEGKIQQQTKILRAPKKKCFAINGDYKACFT